MTKEKSNLIGGRGGSGKIVFDSQTQQVQAEALAKDIAGQIELLTPQERFERIERTVLKMLSFADPEAREEILDEWRGRQQ